ALGGLAVGAARCAYEGQGLLEIAHLEGLADPMRRLRTSCHAKALGVVVVEEVERAAAEPGHGLGLGARKRAHHDREEVALERPDGDRVIVATVVLDVDEAAL